MSNSVYYVYGGIEESDLEPVTESPRIFYIEDRSGRGVCSGATVKKALENAVGKTSLQNLNLDGLDLRCVDLRNVDLSGSTFRNADLQGAKLNRAKLRGCDFYRAHMKKTDLREAELEDASFHFASLDRTYFKRAYLLGATFDGENHICSKLAAVILSLT